MKINKLFVLAMAGLAFAACNKQENSANIEGTGAVTIRISSPEMTKSVDNALTTNDAIKVTGDVTITLTTRTEEEPRVITLTPDQLATSSIVTFWNVEGPEKVTVSMNGGQSSYSRVEPTVFAGIAPESIPAYGETSSFSLSGDTSSPTIGDDHEEGAVEGDQDKVYQLYTASVELAIPVARLEVSGIKHVHDAGASCAYSVLNIAGVYLDNVYATGEGVTYSNGSFPCATGTPSNYSFDGDNGTGDPAILKDEATVTNFLTPDAVWPEEGKAYSYYFYGAEGANMPMFKIFFDESEAVDTSHPLPAPRYAMITSYQNSEGTTINSFEPGKIYRITKAELKDKNVVGDESGNTLYGIVVTVEEASWTVETIDGVWAE